MHIAPIERVHPARIKEMAEHSADFDLGPQANPFPEDSAAFAEWNRVYYARVKASAEACAS